MHALRLSTRIIAGGIIVALTAFLGFLLMVQSLWFQQRFPEWSVSGQGSFFGVFFAASLVMLLAVMAILDRQISKAASAEARLRGVLESVPACSIVTVDAAGLIVSANTQTASMFGYAVEEVIGQPVSLFLPGRPENHVAQSGRDVSWYDPADGTWTGGREFFGRHKEGNEMIMEVSRSAPLADPTGHFNTMTFRDISRRKQTLEWLRQKEGYLRLVVEQMPAILWTTDENLQITSSQGTGLAGLNLQPQEFLRVAMLDQLHKGDKESSLVAVHHKALKGASQNYDMEWNQHTFQMRVEPLRNAEKKITGTIGIVQDVTSRKQHLAEIKARAQQQAAVADLGQRALAGFEVNQLLHEAAKLIVQTLAVQCCKVLEVCPGEKALHWRAGAGWKPGPDPVNLKWGLGSQAVHTLLTKEPVIVENLASERRFAGSPFVREHGVVSGLSVLIPGQNEPFGVLAAFTNQPRKFTEDDLHFLQAIANVLATALERKQAEEAQHRLVAILEATPDFVAIASQDQQLMYLNRAGRELLGLGLSEDIHTYNLTQFLNRQSRDTIQDEGMAQVLSKGVWSGETTLRNRAGVEIPCSQLLLAHKSRGGNVEFYSTIGRDIRERKKLEEQFRQAQKMEAVGRLAGGVAHDFNNLLCVINGYSEFLLQGLEADDKRHGFVKEIKKAGERAAGLTRQLLAFSRKQMLVPCVLNLNSLVGNMEQMLRRLIGEDIELATALDPDLPSVKADPGQIEQILMNLAVNSRDAMTHGGKLTIATAKVNLDEHNVQDHPEAKVGPYVRLAVNDTGCGMNSEVLAHLFEPFFTTKDVGKGTGLGLATVYGIVKQSGGHIDVQSAPGVGTTFNVYLPANSEKVANGEPKRALPPSPDGAETILLVEDEEGVRALACQVLRKHGYKVLEAGDGEEALALAQIHKGEFDLLVSDVVMPRIGGGQLAKRMAPLQPGMKVLFVSGYTESALVHHGVTSGEVECLAKPYSPEVLASKVREVLDRGIPTSTGRDRRNNQRRKPRQSVKVQCLKGICGLGANLALAVENLSEGGAAIVVKSPLQKGQEVEVVLQGSSHTNPVKRFAEVAWLQSSDKEGHSVGLKFRRRLNYAEVQGLT